MLVALQAKVALAEPLWVDPAVIDEVTTAADALWPEGPLEIAPRPAVPGEGFLWDGATLAWIHGGRAWTEPAADAATVVLLARSWLGDAPAVEGWVPAVVVVAPPPPAPPPSRPPPSDTPAGTGLAVGVGARSTFGDVLPDGVRISAGPVAPHLDAEATLFLATGWVAAPTPLETAYVDLTGRSTVLVDVATVSLTGGWDLAAPRRIADRWTAAPVLLAGVQVAQASTRSMRVDRTRVEEARHFEGGALLGVAAELWWGESVGLRGSAVDRFARRTLLGGPPRLVQEVHLGLDLRFVP
jgi:hypothetical protein